MEFEATYLVAVLTPAIHPHVEARRTPKCQRSCVLIAGRTASSSATPRVSSSYGAAHPPYAKPSLVSSSGPPGACMTPSREICSSTIIFLMTEFLRVLSDLV